MKRFIIAIAAAFTLSTPAHAEIGGWFGGNVEVPNRNGDVVVAGGAVTIAGRVEGDAIVAAGQARLNGDVDGDARIMAGEYHQSGSVSGELAIASGKVDIDGLVGDDVYIASEDVRLGPEVRIGHNARIAGQDVLIKGRIDGDLDVQGEEVALDAQIGGDVTIRAKRITLGPDTTIEGKLTWKAAEEPDIPRDAIIAHGVEGNVVKRWEQRGGWAWDRPWSAAPRAAIFAGEAAVRLMVGLSAFLLGALFVVFAPHIVDQALLALRQKWPKALMWGALITGVTPVVAIILLVTIIGIPLGLLGLMAYPLLLLLGYATGATLLGSFVLTGKTPRGRILAAGAGVAALTVFAFLPFLGFLAGFAVTLAGIGVWIVMGRARAA